MGKSHGAHGCPYKSRLGSEQARYLGCIASILKNKNNINKFCINCNIYITLGIHDT